jgi:hypothetical protein
MEIVFLVAACFLPTWRRWVEGFFVIIVSSIRILENLLLGCPDWGRDIG